MNRYSFFKLLEGGGSRRSKAFRNQAAKGSFAALGKREEMGERPTARGVQATAGDTKNFGEGKLDILKRNARHGISAGTQDVKKVMGAHGKKIVGGAAALGAGGLAFLRHRAGKAAEAAKPLNRLKALASAHPGKAALAAGAAGTLGGLMFMRHKGKKGKK